MSAIASNTIGTATSTATAIARQRAFTGISVLTLRPNSPDRPNGLARQGFSEKRPVVVSLGSGPAATGRFFGAGERFRTVDLVLGKHALYQLSYTRSPAADTAEARVGFTT